MMDVEKHVAYWRSGAREDWGVAQDLVQRGSLRHGLFFAHLALEKALNAIVCRKTGTVPPRIHNLVRLAEMAELILDDERRDLLADMNGFNIEGRYPDTLRPLPDRREAEGYCQRAGVVLEWLMGQ